MRNFKKISAIVLVVAMLFSMMSISVFATDSTKAVISLKLVSGTTDTTEAVEKSTIKTMQLKVYLSDENGADFSGPRGTYTISIGLPVGLVSTVTKDEDSEWDFVSYIDGVNAGKPFVSLGSMGSKVSAKANEPIATLTMQLNDTKSIGKDNAFYIYTDNNATVVQSPLTVDTTSTAKVKFVKAFTVATVDPIGEQTANLGDTVESVKTKLNALNIGVKGSAEEDAATLNATNWTCAELTTETITAPGEYTFTGRLQGTDVVEVPDALKTVSVKVKVGKINIETDTGVVIDKVKNVTFQATKEAGTVTEAKILDEAGKITSVAVKKGTGYTGTLTLAGWAVSGETKTLESKTVSTVDKATGVPSTNFVTLTANATAAASDKIFTGVKAVTFYAYITPAEIEGGSFALTDSTFVPNTKPSVKVTIPATVFDSLPEVYDSENTEQYTITVSIPNKTAGEPAETKSVVMSEKQVSDMKTAIAAAKADGKEVSTVAPFTTIVDLDKTLSDLGYDTTDAKKAFTVSVTVGGTTLLTKDGKDSVDGTVVKPSSGGPSGNIGINKGNTTKTYAVTVTETKNGTATVSPDNAAQGTTVTVKAEPAEGYKVKTVTVTKADGTNVPVDEKALTFTMPASAVKVAVEFEEGKAEPSVDPTPADGKFADVADDFWAAKDIYTLKDAGIIGGKSATEFDPEGDVTRAEFAKMVVGLFGYKATSGAVNFTDCGADDWFTEFVAAGVEAGVIKGVSDTEFAPNATITREDACTILGRALNKVAQSAELKFSDADKVAEYAAPYVALLSELGYVNGYEDGSFAPANNITRAEAAKIIAGIYNANKSAETVTDDKTETDANADAAVDEKTEAVKDETATTPEK